MKSRALNVRILDPNEYSLWDIFVFSSPQGTIFDCSDYLSFAAKAASSELKIYGCFKNDELIGGCSLFVKKYGFIGSIASSIGPFTPYGGFLLPKMNSKKVRQSEMLQDSILTNISNKILKDNYFYLVVYNSPYLFDIRPLLWQGWSSQVSYTYYLYLNNLDNLKFSKDIRSNIKKATDAGFYIQKSNDVILHVNLLKNSFKRRNINISVEREFFCDVSKFIEKKNCGAMWIAKNETDEIVASQIDLWDNKNAYSWSAAINPKFQDRGANSFLFINVLNEFKKLGINQVNIMQANIKNFSHHAAGYNPTLVPYYCVKKKSIVAGMGIDIFSSLKKRH